MARSAGAAATVLLSLQALYESGANPELTAGELLALLEGVGVTGFTEDQGSYFLMVGTVLQLLLQHAEADVDGMFAKTLADLDRLGRDIDDEKFEDIAARFDTDQA
jgi:hypothetical protein